MKSERDGINAAVEPSGTGCVECMAQGKWWFHLRRCAECGHIGCCDSSPNQHASKHYAATGHPVITSFEPGEHWFYDYRTEQSFAGPKLPAPHCHPLDQPAPGPAGAVPSIGRAPRPAAPAQAFAQADAPNGDSRGSLHKRVPASIAARGPPDWVPCVAALRLGRYSLIAAVRDALVRSAIGGKTDIPRQGPNGANAPEADLGGLQCLLAPAVAIASRGKPLIA